MYNEQIEINNYKVLVNIDRTSVIVNNISCCRYIGFTIRFKNNYLSQFVKLGELNGSASNVSKRQFQNLPQNEDCHSSKYCKL